MPPRNERVRLVRKIGSDGADDPAIASLGTARLIAIGDEPDREALRRACLLQLREAWRRRHIAPHDIGQDRLEIGAAARISAAVGLRELVARFDCQRVPLALLPLFVLPFELVQASEAVFLSETMIQRVAHSLLASGLVSASLVLSLLSCAPEKGVREVPIHAVDYAFSVQDTVARIRPR
jgi:hypothetical protein